jgi:hypothetical protein
MNNSSVKTRRQPLKNSAQKTTPSAAAKKRKLKNLESSPDNGIRRSQPSRESSLEQAKKQIGTKHVTVEELTTLHMAIQQDADWRSNVEPFATNF